MALFEFTKKGIYCPRADVYIDPWRKVKNALITHGHSDHARTGHENYLCTHLTKPLIQHRLGKINCSSVALGEKVNINGVQFSFHPAGHIVGSAQVRAEYKGEIWVASGDYKVESDGLTQDFEPIKCHHFITESTFGLPIYQWESNAILTDQINKWWKENKQQGVVSIILGYSLGKSQRILHSLDPSIGPIYTHPAVEKINQIIRDQGIDLNPSTEITDNLMAKDFKDALIITPPSALNGSLMDKVKSYAVASASGWMMLKNGRGRKSVDKGFVLSDHADWNGLLSAIKSTEAENIYVTHGYVDELNQYLNESGWNSSIIPTKYEGDIPLV